MLFNKPLWSSFLTGCVPAVVRCSIPIQSHLPVQGYMNCAFCPCTSLVLCCSQTCLALALGPQPLHSHRIKGTLCCVNACSSLYNYREVTDCRGCFSNSEVTHVEDPAVVGTSSCVPFPTLLSRGAHDV